ncbi:MAG: YfiR family protein [Verrucomicrobiota bacterium JB022]|nr:YfiR family protein [Verrucomicrobiota bacterium JB022]
MLRSRFSRLFSVFLAILLAGCGTAYAQHDDEQIPVAAEKLKAAFLFRLCFFVDWEELPADRPFVFLVIGANEIAEELTELVRGKDVEGHAIEVRTTDSLDVVDDAHVVFVSRSFRRWTERIVKDYEGRPVLTVADYRDFPKRGGMVGLFYERDRIALAVNPSKCQDARLQLSARLLAVAREVIEAP